MTRTTSGRVVWRCQKFQVSRGKWIRLGSKWYPLVITEHREPWARRLSSPTCWTWRPTRPGLPSGEAVSGRTWKSVTSGLRLYENHIQTSRPLVNQHTEMVNSLQRDFSAVPVLQKVLLRTGTCAWDFASLLHPDWAQGGQRFWLSASKLLLWTAHKTMAFQFDPERQKNCLLRVSYLKDKDSMLNHQGKVFPNFYLHLLPLFANIQFPDYSLILPAFLATYLFLVAFSPFNTFSCPSPSLVLFPPFPPICDPSWVLVQFAFDSEARKNCPCNSCVPFYNTFSCIYLQVPGERGGPIQSSLNLHNLTTSVLSDLYHNYTWTHWSNKSLFCRIELSATQEIDLSQRFNDWWEHTAGGGEDRKCGTALHRKGSADGSN